MCPFTIHSLRKALRHVRSTSEGKQYIKPVPVFVSVNPKYDTPEKLVKYRDEMFGPELIVLRETTSESPNLRDMLRRFKVPYGLNDDEKAQLQDFFDSPESKNPGFFTRASNWLNGKGNKQKTIL